MWVYHAFGPFWGFQEGYWSWISGAIDNAIYPALTVATLNKYTNNFESPLASYFVKVGIATACAIPNFLGIKFVGGGIVAMCVAVMVPFLVRANINNTYITMN